MDIMKIEKQYSGVVGGYDIKPYIEGNNLFFPISIQYVNTDQFGGDGRSFGYQADSGMVTFVTFEKAVGVLADDVVAYYLEQKSIKVDKPDFLEYFEYSNNDACVEEDTVEAKGELVFDGFDQAIYKYRNKLFVQTTYAKYPVFEQIVNNGSHFGGVDDLLQMLCNDKEMAIQDIARKNVLTRRIKEGFGLLEKVYPLIVIDSNSAQGVA